jgi:hypothetical protein
MLQFKSFKKNLRKILSRTKKKRTSSKPLFSKKNDIKFVEYDVSYYDSELKIEVLLSGIVETNSLQVLSWTNLTTRQI